MKFDGGYSAVAFSDTWDVNHEPTEFSSPWVGRTVFIDSDTLEASENEAAESAESSEADSIVSLDFTSVTPRSPASSDAESIAVDRPRGRL
eukprot:3098152-Lingulodinium_polyedra.AAC.1